MSAEQVAIRRAAPSDIPAIVALLRAFHAEAGFALNEPSTSLALQQLLNTPAYGALWLALQGNTALGFISLNVTFALEFEGLCGAIDDLYVAPAARRQGIGDLLLRTLVQDCRARGCKAIKVEVGADNTGALALYARHGLVARTDERLVLTTQLLTATKI